MWGFTRTLLDRIEGEIEKVLIEGIKGNSLKCEYFLPFVVDDMLKGGECKVDCMVTEEKWYGVTYARDKELVQNAIDKMIESGVYPDNLWEVK
jgi:hypothetical protein